MKASKRMEATIARLEKRLGKLEHTYGTEFYECNRVGKGYYDYCLLTSPIFLNWRIFVHHDGTWQKMN